MNQQKESPEIGERVLPEGEKKPDEKPAKPLEHGPPVEPAEQTVEAPDPFGGGPVNRPAKEQARTCGICGGPDHRGCGCETKQKKIEQDNNTGLARFKQELERDEMVEKNLSKDVVASAMHDQLSDIITALNMIVSQLDVLIESDKSRRDLLMDIQNANPN